MTVNKAQGQTLKRVGVYLPDSCFTHGQLYVAASRVGLPAHLRFAVPWDEETGSFRPDVATNCIDPEWLAARAILTPLNATPRMTPIPRCAQPLADRAPSLHPCSGERVNPIGPDNGRERLEGAA